MDEFEGDYLLTDNEWDELLWVWKRTDAPKGCKAEIIQGLVTVAPYSAVAHHRMSEPLKRHLYEVIPDSFTKAAGYAEAGVPLYLLADRLAPSGPTVTLYGEPEDGTYRVLASAPFGSPVELSAPFLLTFPVD
ncbi:hypothetical protein ACWET9_00950 [Streptomyces sp. NPDC004059]